MTGPNPILSICLPTMNRAELLEIGLMNPYSEVEAFPDEVELIVTDNGTEGDIQEIARRISPRIRFAKVEQAPVIFTKSILFAPTSLARGDYVWIIGDDDQIVRGSVRRILSFLKSNPHLDYVYLNHGWLPTTVRNNQILQEDSRIPDGYDFFQCEEKSEKVLKRIEDLIDLKGASSFGMFTTIFCYVAKRSLYLNYSYLLNPPDTFVPEEQTLDNLFPHSKLTTTVYAGKPVGYIGEPCFMQGCYQQEDHSWIYKTMVLGNLMLYDWLKQTRYDRVALARFWEGLAEMTGRYMVWMLAAPSKYSGLDLIRKQALPRLVQSQSFLTGFRNAALEHHETDLEANLLIDRAREAATLARLERPRIAIWGVKGRGYRCLELSEWVRSYAAFTIDVDRSLQGRLLINQSVYVQAPAFLSGHPVDILILAMRRYATDGVIAEAASMMNDGSLIISLGGRHRVKQGRAVVLECGSQEG